MPHQSPNAHEHAPTGSDAMEFRKVASALVERLWLVILCLLLSGAATFVYLYRAVPIYEATASIRVDTERLQLLDVPTVINENIQNPQMVDLKLKQERRLLLSPTLLATVIETNGLAKDPLFTAGQTATNLPQLVQFLTSLITVEVPRNDTLLNITVEHPNPELAARLANSLVELRVQQSSVSKEDIIRMASTRLQGALRGLTDEARVAEQSLRTNRDQSLRLGYELNEVSQHLNDINRMRVEATLQRIAVEAEQNEVQRVGTNLDALLRITSVASDPTVVGTRTTIAQKEILFNNLKQRYKPKHPTYIAATSELASLRNSLAEAVAIAAQGVKVSLDAARAKENTLQKDYETLNVKVQELTRSLIQSTNNPALQEFEMQSALQNKLMQRLKETSLSTDLFSSPINVFQHAAVPLKPVKPDKLRVTLLGLFAGLVLGVGLALALGLVDSSFKSVEDAETFLNLPVIGAVPRIAALESADSQVLMADEAHFIPAEAFRSLRTSVSVLAKERELRSFVFTSAMPEEGKTLCTLNYAASLAQQGLRTLLIECDLRRPMAAVALSGLKADAPGVADYLKLQPVGAAAPAFDAPRQGEAGLSFTELRRKQRGAAESAATRSPAAPAAAAPTATSLGFDDIVQSTGIENLFFISAGNPAPNPSELLARQGINKLVGEAVRRFDRVVIDAAPMLGISDSLLLVNHVQATCLVVRAHRTPRKAVARAVDILQRAEAPLLGVILNDLSATRSDQYGDYYHYYGREARASTRGA
jgi:uncharacterized protein involved in exopolysaccharide biosynthesis/Mrp family chromosome partitioning ATPase